MSSDRSEIDSNPWQKKRLNKSPVDFDEDYLNLRTAKKPVPITFDLKTGGNVPDNTVNSAPMPIPINKLKLKQYNSSGMQSA